MSNKRDFKKYVEAIGASACGAMMETYYTVEAADKDAISKALEKVLGATAAARANANVFFDKGVKAFADRREYSKAKKEFFVKLFNKINSDFTKELDAALKMFNEAIPADVKDAQKKAVAE